MRTKLKKRCPKCSRRKHTSEFYNYRGSKDRLTTYCKSCDNRRKTKWVRSNKKHCRKFYRSVWQRRSRRLIRKVCKYLSAHPCADCGETNILCLDFDHRKGQKKSGNISTMMSKTKSWKVIKREIKKCDVRCANCHRIKTSGQFNRYKVKVAERYAKAA